VYNAIAENKFFSLLSIVQPEDPGCFCPSNALLKKVIQSISRDFEIILIDCEAGLEQINRKVIESIDYLLLVTDISLRSVDTADSIRNSADKFTHYKHCGVIINKVEGNISKIIEKLLDYNLPILDKIPRDEELIKMELQGLPIIDINKKFVSYMAMRKITNLLMELLTQGNNPLNS
jgi:CO dehydrogenase maturation factor